MRVRVPLGRQTRTGVVAAFAHDEPAGGARPVLDLLDTEPFLPDDLLELVRWTARYYLASVAEVIATIVPARLPGETRERRVLLARELPPDAEAALGRRAPARALAYRLLREAGDHGIAARALRAAGVGSAALRALVATGIAVVSESDSPGIGLRRDDTGPPPPAPSLLPAQRSAVAAITDALHAGTGGSFLLHGITGSGKTEVFLAAAATALAQDRDVLILVPEIALTHQAVDRVRLRFGDHVAVLHSGLGARQRWQEWRRIRARAARVIVGARSAVFAPVARLGLVVVDEEHDTAYKQDDGIRYNARDVAIVRARLAGVPAVLASATPSAESWAAAQDGRHRLLVLSERPTGQQLPHVELVDLREQAPRPGGPELLSEPVRRAIAETLASRRQALLFLNRRGFAAWLQCPACGVAAECPHCSVTLTWHRALGFLVCHQCQYRARPVALCPQCGGAPLQAFGVGTEQIEASVRACFPGAAVRRLDRDVAARPAAQRRILGEWGSGDTDVLVGTQMVSKGHDVPGVALVAVLLADLSLNVPDFRAGERTFQLLVQVAGRAGRGTVPGRVLIQTLRPGHPALSHAVRHDFAGFMAGELARRRALAYPPFARLIALRIEGPQLAAVEATAEQLATELRALALARGLGASSVLGPAPPPVARLKNRHRRQILLRAADVRGLRALARAARAREQDIRSVRCRLIVDIDPYTM